MGIIDHQHPVQLLHVEGVEENEDEGPVDHEEQGGRDEEDVREVEHTGRQVLHATESFDEVDVVAVRLGVGRSETTEVLKKTAWS